MHDRVDTNENFQLQENGKTVLACQFLTDLYGCDSSLLDDPDKVIEIAHEVIARCNAGVVEEACHKFAPIGVSYIAVITKSHMSIHTWPEYGYAAVDVFSCTDSECADISELLEKAFKASSTKTTIITRQISDNNDD